jgi:hypothetical protein
MQVKKRHFREWEVVEWLEMKRDGMYQVQESLHHRKCIFYFFGKYIKKSLRLTVRATTSVPGDCRVLFFKRDQ